MFLWRPHKFERCSPEANGLLLPNETHLQIKGWLMFCLNLWTVLNHTFLLQALDFRIFYSLLMPSKNPNRVWNVFRKKFLKRSRNGSVNLNRNCMQKHLWYSCIVYLTIFVLIATFQGLCGGDSIIDLCSRSACQILCPWRRSSECHWTSVTMPESVLFPR